jgi:hypothetical protein
VECALNRRLIAACFRNNPWQFDRNGTFVVMARPERFELPTSWFVARRSIQLSYGRVQRRQLIYIGPRADGGELP